MCVRRRLASVDACSGARVAEEAVQAQPAFAGPTTATHTATPAARHTPKSNTATHHCAQPIAPPGRAEPQPRRAPPTPRRSPLSAGSSKSRALGIPPRGCGFVSLPEHIFRPSHAVKLTRPRRSPLSSQLRPWPPLTPPSARPIPSPPRACGAPSRRPLRRVCRAMLRWRPRGPRRLRQGVSRLRAAGAAVCSSS
jgi:hypothetical protein